MLVPYPWTEDDPTFNLHKLWPDEFSSDDLAGFKDRSLLKMRSLTGCKWNPVIDYFQGDDDGCRLEYDTAWEPNNPLLARLHEVTGWKIVNKYREEQPSFFGTFTCKDGLRSDDKRMAYRGVCICLFCRILNPA